MEKGEIGVLAVQFGVLILVVLLLSDFAAGTNSSSTPSVSDVYWGSPPPLNGTSISHGTNTETVNASTISYYYTLAYSTHLVSTAATRFCTNPLNTSQAGGELGYSSIPRTYDSAKGSFYFTFGPTSQPAGWDCTYSITITDSLQQSTTWVGTVVVKAPAPSAA